MDTEAALITIGVLGLFMLIFFWGTWEGANNIKEAREAQGQIPTHSNSEVAWVIVAIALGLPALVALLIILWVAGG